MTTLVHADIFFFVTTIAVVVVAIAFVVALVYLIAVLRRIRDVMEEVKAEAILVRDDIHNLRDQVRSGGFKLASLFSFAGKLFNIGKLFNFKKKRSKK
jgi:hypothetical protein